MQEDTEKNNIQEYNWIQQITQKLEDKIQDNFSNKTWLKDRIIAVLNNSADIKEFL